MRLESKKPLASRLIISIAALQSTATLLFILWIFLKEKWIAGTNFIDGFHGVIPMEFVAIRFIGEIPSALIVQAPAMGFCLGRRFPLR